jgi:hypothetical protein
MVVQTETYCAHIVPFPVKHSIIEPWYNMINQVAKSLVTQCHYLLSSMMRIRVRIPSPML